MEPIYTPPHFPSLYWPPQAYTYTLVNLSDMWKFTLLWTIIIYGIFHFGAAAIALAMQIGKSRSNWKYLWVVPIIYTLIAGFEALFAGSFVGLMSVSSTFCLRINKTNNFSGSVLFTFPDGSQCQPGFPSYGAGSTCWCS
jgi:hypothetical protein